MSSAQLRPLRCRRLPGRGRRRLLLHCHHPVEALHGQVQISSDLLRGGRDGVRVRAREVGLDDRKIVLQRVAGRGMRRVRRSIASKPCNSRSVLIAAVSAISARRACQSWIAALPMVGSGRSVSLASSGSMSGCPTGANWWPVALQRLKQDCQKSSGPRRQRLLFLEPCWVKIRQDLEETLLLRPYKDREQIAPFVRLHHLALPDHSPIGAVLP